MSKVGNKPQGKKKPPVKGGKGAKGTKDDPKKVTEKPEPPEESEKEKLLKAELEAITQEVEEAKSKVVHLRQDNEWLQEETRKIRMENHEYMAYMEKKAHNRQTAIISLSDHHKKELEDLKKERQAMMEEFEKKKQVLLDQILDKDNALARLNCELEDLHEYKVLQQEQTATIKNLEKEIIELQAKHSEAITKMKANFLADKEEFEAASQQKIADMTKQANKEATMCLNEHTVRVQQQNRQMRKELLLLIRKTQGLYEHKRRLEEQRQQLLTERQYAADMKNIRSNRKQKAIEAVSAKENKMMARKEEGKGV